MQARRSTGIIISLLLIIALVLVFTDPWSTLSRRGSGVKLTNVGIVDRISIADRSDSVQFLKVSEEWLLFGREPVNEVALENLIFVAERLQVVSTVPDSVEPLPASSKRIAFLKGNEIVLEYDLYTHAGRDMIRIPGKDQLYYVGVPGYSDLNLNRIFSVSVNHYLEHILIDLLPSEISKIEVIPGEGQAYGFMQNEEGEISWLREHMENGDSMEDPDEMATRLLFSYFTSIRFERKAGIMVDQITQATPPGVPLATLYVESFDGKSYTLKVFPFLENTGGKPHMFKALVAFNEDTEALLVNYIYLDVLMRDKSHYFGRME